MSYDSDSPEFVSSIALEVLEELLLRVIECRLVLQALPGEADLNFDELDGALHVTQQSACEAHDAAWLVHQGARLNARWGTGWSRPKAIFARHGAAVQDGANKVNLIPNLGHRLDRSMWQLPAPDRVEDVVGVRPRCAGAVRATKLRCSVSAIYLGSGVYGAHCYSHATPAERDQYRQHNDLTLAAQADSHGRLLGFRRAVGEKIADRWRQHRETKRQWVEEICTAAQAQPHS